MNVIEVLLENTIIVRANNEELYYKIKSELTPEIQGFIKEKLGYKIRENYEIIKLEKIPGKPQEFMGILDFTDRIQYVYLSLICMFLETIQTNEQFVLSQLIDYIKTTEAASENINEKIDFDLREQRVYMAKVLKYVKSQGFIKLCDGTEEKFAESVTNDILYKVTGVSKYFIRIFSSDIAKAKNYKEIVENEELGLSQEDGRERRQRVYRRLITEGVIYEHENQADYQYIKQYGRIIQKDLERFLDSRLQIHKNVAYMLVNSNEYKNVFPTSKSVAEVTLFFNTVVMEKYKEKKLNLDGNECITLNKNQFVNIIEEVKEKYQEGFSKEYREKSIPLMVEEVCKYMKEFSMLEIDDEEYKLMPIIFKLKGKYM